MYLYFILLLLFTELTVISILVLQIIHYYLVDDTVEIREVHTGNDGRDPFPVLVCRQRLPKDRTNVECKYNSQLSLIRL